MFYSTGIILSFFLCLLLLGKKNKAAADYLLAFWLFWIGGHLWLYYLSITEKIYVFPALLGLSIPMPLVHPPLLFLYTAALCRGRLQRYWWVHFLPALACYLYMIPFDQLPVEQKIWVFQHKGAGYEAFLMIVNTAINISGVGYTLFAYRLLRQHRRIIADLFSNQEKINLQWLQNLIYGLAVIWVAVLAGNDPAVFGAAVLFVLFIGYFGVRQVGIFTNHTPPSLAPSEYHAPAYGFVPVPVDLGPGNDTLESSSPDNLSPDKKKYEKSGLSPEAAETLHQRLRQLMADQQLFRESELSLTDLAELLDVHPNYLSQIINEKEGKNFYDYINSMRVEAFLNMVADPENRRRFTLFALSLECGFNSKSAFNRCFKKAVGKSPTEYLQSFEF